MMDRIHRFGLLALLPMLLVALTACGSSSFSGQAGQARKSKSALKGSEKDLNDGGDVDGPDASDGPDAGDDGEGDDDEGDSDVGDDGEGDTGKGGSDDNGDDDGDEDGDDDPGEDDGEVTANNTHDLIVTRTREDQSFQIKVELIVKNVTKKTETLAPPSEGGTITFKGMCRNDKETKLHVTIIGDGGSTFSTTAIQDDAPADTTTCIYKSRRSDKSYQLDFDPGGFGGSGSNCGKGEDDVITLECPDARKLELM